MKMAKEGSKLAAVVNIGVLMAFLAVFIFVEVKHIKDNRLVSNFVATIVLAALIMMLGVMTIFPMFAAYFGKTLVIFSVLICIGVIASLYYKPLNLFMAIELLLGITAFLYGKELALKGSIAVKKGG